MEAGMFAPGISGAAAPPPPTPAPPAAAAAVCRHQPRVREATAGHAATANDCVLWVRGGGTMTPGTYDKGR